MYQCYVKNELKTYIEDTDNCIDCANQIDCPLIGGLFAGVIVIEYESMSVDNCGMFKRKTNVKNMRFKKDDK